MDASRGAEEGRRGRGKRAEKEREGGRENEIYCGSGRRKSEKRAGRTGMENDPTKDDQDEAGETEKGTKVRGDARTARERGGHKG